MVLSHYLLTSNDTDYYVTVQVYGDNKPLTLPVRTKFKAFRHQLKWDEWLTLPIKYCDLPSSAQLAVSVWCTRSPRKVTPIGGSTMSIFGKHRKTQIVSMG
ncbi:phosphoinositide 3-kinase [Hesseltinella vesiculosa]|uniref:Phosphoinositide 3-kinase n=1 Tax=Hesseltinella vesiculosa TaxID=101127 RepID=A0A1X2G3A0_9FUNG|nr:phosphoinositide 3-kinase [Hesseltinella vesiculosa]